MLKGWGSEGGKSEAFDHRAHSQPGSRAHNPLSEHEVERAQVKCSPRLGDGVWPSRRKQHLFLQGSHFPCFVLFLKRKKLRTQLNTTGCVQKILRKADSAGSRVGTEGSSPLSPLAAGSVALASCDQHFLTVRTFAQDGTVSTLKKGGLCTLPHQLDLSP